MADGAPVIQQVDAFQITESVSSGIRVVTLRPVDLSRMIGTRWWRKDPRLRVHHGKTVIFTVVGFAPHKRGGDGLPLVLLASTARKPGSEPARKAVTFLTDHYERAPG